MIDIDAMRLGMAAGEFFLEYCPIVSLATGACVGGEALVRWRRPAGVVMPDAFIPIAENTPFSGELSYWVIETSAAELGAWLRDNPALCLSINVPPEILGRGGIRYAADKCGLTAMFSQLILEITERGVPDLIGVNALNDYASWGMRIAIDDVSRVGGANLALLSRAPLSVIKLDRSLIAQIDPQSPRPDWLEGVASMIRSTELTVIAEGVETEAQALAARDAGIQAAQGFFFSRPVGAASLMAWCRQAPWAWPPAALS
jgi:EAL domain-containing protein (putative c-di-GMP-specific phosphodiesterase class I)